MGTKLGRKAGGRNKGFFYHAAKGVWTARESGTGARALLRDESGEPLTLKSDKKAAEVAHKKWVAERATQLIERLGEIKQEGRGDHHTIFEVCDCYIDHLKSKRKSTLRMRSRMLFDFAYGLPVRFMNRTESKPNDKIHCGFGKLSVAEFVAEQARRIKAGERDIIDQWLAAPAHSKWSISTQGIAIAAIKRAFSFAATNDEGQKTFTNPLQVIRQGRNLVSGKPMPKIPTPKVKFINESQEAAMLSVAAPHLAAALRTLIRTGMRPGCEFAALTAEHITITPEHRNKHGKQIGERLEFRFDETESKTHKERIIFVCDPEIISLIKGLMVEHPTGAIFRNASGTRYTAASLGKEFRDLTEQARATGTAFKENITPYHCRHSFAKKALTGAFGGVCVSMEMLATNMGNSEKVCRRHYAQFCEDLKDAYFI